MNRQKILRYAEIQIMNEILRKDLLLYVMLSIQYTIVGMINSTLLKLKKQKLLMELATSRFSGTIIAYTTKAQNT
jgi:hypothetical protein